MFLNEVNRTFESVIDPSFQSKYDRWCERRESKDAGHTPFAADDELGDDFEILVLRVCLLSIQSLPCPGYPAFGVLNTHLNQLENWFCSLADELEASQKQERKPSIVAVQHKLCHVCYLIKYAKVRACWSALNAAIKEAHETGLHRRDDNAAVDDLEMELRRQIFWNLYVWDRYMCVYFGFWPLIPEGYFDVELPRDLFRPLTATPGSVTTFTDRVYHIKIARYITAFTSPPSWKADRHNASLVAEFAQQFQVLVVDQLPSIYWLDNPDLRLDTVEPAIPRKRQFLHLAIYHTKASLYRAFADPFNRLHVETNTPPKHTPDLLALSHRRAYMDAICKAISCLVQLFASTTEKSGSAAEKLFLLPVWLIDALACLGVCFLSIQADERRLANQGLQISPDQDLKCCLVTFLNTFDILRRGASRSAFVKKGLEALETLYQIVYTSPCRELLLKSNEESEMATLGAFSVRGTEEWLPSFLEKPDRAWIFQQKSFFSDLLS
ncbi:hypothetical protein PDE_07254 [Penicillium oxalicum 114-2]|uniref:Xylanolytic transcriptional activator regulatory domain-containing protein n=1 Tax=Penicillium oxalicum (strain 114-2 / CGMCC 5302) TaxID=933388 RepID=S7ZPH9_PENO1|nr:hypothetical protein PDE_07254 [Penicillium oxalicum 114-2]